MKTLNVINFACRFKRHLERLGMKTIVGVLCLLTVLSILGVLVVKDLRSMATAEDGSSATSLQQVQKNIDLSAEKVVKQGQPNFNDD